MIMKKFVFSIIASFICGVGYIVADNLSDAKDLYTKGEYAKALPLFEKELKKKPKDGAINHWYGVCLYETGQIDKAEKYLKYGNTRNVIESPRYLAKICFEKYDFQGALEMFARYREIMERNKRVVSPEAEFELKKIKQAKSMMDHVEKIAIIDSIVVDKDTFFKHYLISEETGTLTCQDDSSSKAIVYTEQSGDRKIWAGVDINNNMCLFESAKLIDDSWDEPRKLEIELHDAEDINYPFIMQDGTTLYFAANGETSLGGYDIYFTVKDTESGEYMLPQNVGMPYNSPADDYMLVLDDVTGLGWWATDRNHISGKVTIYVFVRNDMRENYGENEADLASFAKVTNYHATWNGNDYSQLLNKVRMMNTNAHFDDAEFVFSVKKGTIYTSFADFQSEAAAEQMHVLLDLYNKMSQSRATLKEKRASYNKAGAYERVGIQSEILKIENDVELLRGEIFKTENNVRKLEQQ